VHRRDDSEGENCSAERRPCLNNIGKSELGAKVGWAKAVFPQLNCFSRRTLTDLSEVDLT
jgi:hypothetical protein